MKGGRLKVLAKIKRVVGEAHTKKVLAAALLIASAFVLGIHLLNPVSIEVHVGGGEEPIAVIPGYFTQWGVAVIVTSSIVLGISASYLFFGGPTEAEYRPIEAKRERKQRERLSQRLKELGPKERKIYDILVKEKGLLFQGEIAERAGLSKSTTSVVLGRLEAAGLVERKAHGMSKVVRLKHPSELPRE
ncbi:unnamed protein product [marine sediment metagenome]|uniref:HTH marR-type domain-containing protein n=1 Tax=marine sediment metagenome TaxID=412755 RepID=X1RYR2_9ZZZZ